MSLSRECEKCNCEFIAAVKAQASLVNDASKCIHYQRKHLEKMSNENANLELNFCKKCQCWICDSI